MHSAWRLALLISGALLLVLTNGRGAVDAQEPPLPTNRIVSRFPVTTSPAQHDLVQLTLDFPSGSATALHSHSGPVYVTVLEGQITRTEGGVKTVHAVGQTFTEQEMKPHIAANEGNVPARVLASVVLSPGEAPTINDPNAPLPGVQPKTTFLSRTTLGTQPGEFEVTHVVVDFGPGAYLPMHTHGGAGIVTVDSGEIEFGKASGNQRLSPGGVFLEVVDPHTARNMSSGNSTLLVSFLIRKGAAITTFINPPAAAPAPAVVTPPNTGDGGLLPEALSSHLTAAVLSSGILVTITLGGAVLVRRNRRA